MTRFKIPFWQPRRHEIKDVELSDVSSASTISIPSDHGTIDYRPVSFIGLARYALPHDRVLHIFGVIFCMIAGTALPLMTVVLGSMTNLFIDIAQGGSIAQTQHSINLRALYLVVIAIAVAFATYVSTYCFVSTGHKLANRIREKYLGAILRQDIAYIDQTGVSTFIDGLAFHVDLVQDGLSEKLGLAITSATTFVAAMIVAFMRSPKLAAIMSTMLPFMFASTGLVGSGMAKHSRYASDALSSANDVAREITSSSRIVQGLGVEDRLCSLYTSKLWLCAKSGSQKYLWQGLMMGSISCILYLGYALAFWEGSRLLGTQQLDTGTVVNVLFVIIIAAFSLGQVASNLQVFTKALEAGRRIFETIDRVP